MIEQGLFVSDIFSSIQGEGPKMGTPSIFLRLGICNLQCAWCDTPYTWRKGETDYTKRSFSWILEKIAELRKKTQARNLVITGGEPLLQQNMLADLLVDNSLQDFDIEIETNGSMPLLPKMKSSLRSKRVSFNISPKLEDSGNKPYKVHVYSGAILKFIYCSKKSEQLIDAFLEKQLEFVSKKKVPSVYIMPEGTTVAHMEKNYTDILNFCLLRGFTFTPRLHIYLFGNKRAT